MFLFDTNNKLPDEDGGEGGVAKRPPYQFYVGLIPDSPKLSDFYF